MKSREWLKIAALFHSGILLVCSLGVIQGISQEKPRDLTEIPLEELNKVEVYSASKFNQKVTEAPASISILTATEIQHFGYRTFAEILNSITGFFTTYDRNYDYVGVRGFGRTGDYNTRILILLNGLRLNENIYGSTAVGTDFPISVDLIERVEVVRGPGSSLYGTNAFFGTVNVITKKGISLEGGRLVADAGSRQTYGGTAIYGDKFGNGLEMLVSSSYRSSKGYRQLYYSEFDTPETNNGIAQDSDTGRNASVYANVSFRDLTAQVAFNTRDKRVPTAAYGTVFNERDFETTDRTTYLDLKFERSIRRNWDILARTYAGFYRYDGAYGYEYPEGLVRNIDYASGRWWGGEFQVTRSISGRHHLTFGTDWQYSFEALQKNWDESPYYLYLNTDDKWTSTGAFLQGEFAVRDNLLVSAGFRHDQYTTFGGNTSPRLGIVYSPQPKTTAKLLYGHAFRAPNNYELRYDDGYSMRTNPDLKPEKIRTVELVLERYLGRRFRIAGSGYHYRVNGLITAEIGEDNLSVFSNIGEVHANGIEIELEGKDFHGFDGRISYALQRAVAKEFSSTLPNSPRHVAQLNLFVPCFSARGGAGLEMRYMGERKTLSQAKVGGFLLTNITFVYKKLLPNLNLSASVYNLFNKRYSDPASEEHLQDSLLQDGRGFRIRIGYGFSSQ